MAVVPGNYPFRGFQQPFEGSNNYPPEHEGAQTEQEDKVENEVAEEKSPGAGQPGMLLLKGKCQPGGACRPAVDQQRGIRQNLIPFG